MGFWMVGILADAIARMEGYGVAGSRAQRNNNPGNIWDGSKHRIWPKLPIDEKGFIKYPTPEAGRAALEYQLNLKIRRGATLRSLITVWAPPHENDTNRYIDLVAKWTGLPLDKPLKDLPKPDEASDAQVSR